jgi:hypothetical protein
MSVAEESAIGKDRRGSHDDERRWLKISDNEQKYEGIFI